MIHDSLNDQNHRKGPQGKIKGQRSSMHSFLLRAQETENSKEGSGPSQGFWEAQTKADGLPVQEEPQDTSS